MAAWGGWQLSKAASHLLIIFLFGGFLLFSVNAIIMDKKEAAKEKDQQTIEIKTLKNKVDSLEIALKNAKAEIDEE